MVFMRSHPSNKALWALLLCLFLWQTAVYGQGSSAPQNWCASNLAGTTGKQTSPVPDTAAEVLKYSAQHFQDFAFLPLIPANLLANLHQVENDGGENRGTYEAKLNGQDVFIKISTWGTKDAIWLTYLNRYGLGVQFFGVTPMGNGRWGTVMEKIDGISSKGAVMSAFKEIPRIVRQSMRDQIQRLYELGIYPDDVQFVMTAEKATLVDVTRYKTLDPEVWTLEKIIQEYEESYPYFKLD
jgi:hypothetical protein